MNAFAAIASASVLSWSHYAVAAPTNYSETYRQPLTVSAAIETSRLLSPRAVLLPSGAFSDSDSDGLLISPRATRYVLLLVRGDVEQNGVWLDLLSGPIGEQLSLLDPPARVASLFMTARGTLYGYSAGIFALDGFNLVQWINEETIAFLWGDDRDVAQLFYANLLSGEVNKVTSEKTDVFDFRVSQNGSIYYFSRNPLTAAASKRLRQTGFAVPHNIDLLTIMYGFLDGTSFVEAGNATTMRLMIGNAPAEVVKLGDGRATCLIQSLFSISGDGKRGLVDVRAPFSPTVWRAYDDELVRFLVTDAERISGPGCSTVLSQPLYFEVGSSEAGQLLPFPVFPQTAVAWSPNGASLILGPTFLPVDTAILRGLSGKAFVEFDPVADTYLEIPVSTRLSQSDAHELHWCLPNTLEISASDGMVEVFRRGAAGWSRAAKGCSVSGDERRGQVELKIVQSATSPPILVARDAKRKTEKPIADPNCQLTERYELGRVESINWRDSEGRTWSGRLNYPTKYRASNTYPLIVQVSAPPPADVFSLYGKADTSLGPGVSIYSAQVLSNRQFFVLNIEEKYVENVTLTEKEPALFAAAIEAGVRHLLTILPIDTNRVGLGGFSRTSVYVEYALAHSDFPYAAAISSDGGDGYLVATSFLYGHQSTSFVGTMPFGIGLANWLQHSPPMIADRIRTPLMLAKESGGIASVLGSWEMFARLQALGAPVELYLVPDIEFGSHGLQRPSQLMALQQRAVDWFDFWLQSFERTMPAKNESHAQLFDQYSNWRMLRDRRDILASRPRPPLRHWMATSLPAKE